MNTRKYVEDLLVGDWVVGGGRVGKVARVMPDRLEIAVVRDNKEVYETVLISRVTGKQFGEQHYWSVLNESGSEAEADLWFEQNRQRKEERRKKADAERARVEAKLQGVRDMNPVLTVEPFFKDMQKVVFRNALGREGVLIFRVERKDCYDANFNRIENGYRLRDVIAYSDDGRENEEYAVHSLSSSTGNATLEEELYDAIYTLWH